MSRDGSNASRHAALMLGATALGVGLGDLRLLAGLGILSLFGWVWQHPAAIGSAAQLRGANAITALRIGLSAALAWLGARGLVPWGGVLVLAVFALDGLDGWWARRTRTATPFGAAFDQEADAFLVTMTSAALVQAELAPSWVLLTGALRYGYVLVVHGLRLRGEAPRSTIARYVFAVLVLCMSAAMLWPSPITRGALRLASALLVWSFGRSLWWSWRGPAGRDREQP
ncbi:MAG: CDP-alcohol phosphatidyltransferase family protein [Myxococcota bacterium]